MPNVIKADWTPVVIRMQDTIDSGYYVTSCSLYVTSSPFHTENEPTLSIESIFFFLAVIVIISLFYFRKKEVNYTEELIAQANSKDSL